MVRLHPRWLLIIGLAYVFGTFGIEKIFYPLFWIQWIPPSLDGFLGLSRAIWLTIAGVLEILLAGFLLIPRRKLQRVIAILMAVYLVFVLSQTGLWSDVSVRDTGLLFMALGLALYP